jgi:hypothetical protein
VCNVIPALQRLPDHMVLIRPIVPGILAVGAHEDRGALFWTKVELADLPENLTRPDDLIGATLEAVDRLAAGQLEKSIGGDRSTRLPFTSRSKCVGLNAPASGPRRRWAPVRSRGIGQAHAGNSAVRGVGFPYSQTEA